MYPRTLYLSTTPWTSEEDLLEAVSAGLVFPILVKTYEEDVQAQRQGHRPIAEILVVLEKPKRRV